MNGVDVTVGSAERDQAKELTALHRRTARQAFSEIFPPEASPPTYEEDLAQWRHWLGPDFDLGRRCYVARTPSATLVGVVLAGPDPDDRSAGHLARLYVDPKHWGRGVG